jgi:hypothetical protein
VPWMTSVLALVALSSAMRRRHHAASHLDCQDVMIKM